MNKIKLKENQKIILNALKRCEYSNSIPDEDIDDIIVLMEFNLVKAIEVSDKSGRMFICPELTDKGRAYMVLNPDLKNPSIWDDKKYIINTIISVAALAVAMIALFR